MGDTREFQLGSWRVHPSRNLVTGDDREVRLEPRAMEVLCFLAERRGDVVPRREILREVWSDTHVSDEALTYAVSQIRKALGDDAKSPRFVENVPRRGYRLMAPVMSSDEPTAEGHNRVFYLRRSGLVVLALAIGAFVWLEMRSRLSHVDTAVAILPFDDHTIAADFHWLAEGVPSMLTTHLAQTPGLMVVSLEQTGSRDLDAARRIGADRIIAGSVYHIGPGVRIDARMEEVSTGRILFAHSVSGENVFRLVDELTGAFRSDLKVSTSDERPLSEITTASIDAYRFYSEGVSAARNARWEDAWTSFHKAIELDPEFDMAYFQLSKLHRPNRPFLRAQYRHFVQQRLERLPEQHRLFVRASYEEDPDRAVELFEKFLERYPEEEDAYRLLSTYYVFERNQPERGLEVMAKGLSALPRSGALRNELGYQLLDLGRNEEAMREFEAYTEVSPDEPNPYHSLGHAYLVSSDPEKALAAFDRALENSSTFYESHVGRAWTFAILGRYVEALDEAARVAEVVPRDGYEKVKLENLLMRAFMLSRVGRYREAEASIERGLDLARATRHPANVASFSVLSVLIDLELGETARAIERAGLVEKGLGSGLAENEVRSVLALLRGVAEARTGNVEAARSRLGSMEDALSTDIARYWRHALEGEIALSEGDAAAAERAFSAGEPRQKVWFSDAEIARSIAANGLFRDGMARARAARGDLEGAIAAYRALLAWNKTTRWTAMLEPRYVLGLARLLEASGQRVQAAKEYERFLDLWESADEDLPELRDAARFGSSSISISGRPAIFSSSGDAIDVPPDFAAGPHHGMDVHVQQAAVQQVALLHGERTDEADLRAPELERTRIDEAEQDGSRFSLLGRTMDMGSRFRRLEPDERQFEMQQVGRLVVRGSENTESVAPVVRYLLRCAQKGNVVIRSGRECGRKQAY